MNTLKQCLIDGFPFVFAFKVFSNFESKETKLTGFVYLPKNTDTYVNC